MIFVPTARSLTVDSTELKPDTTFEWVDPVSGARLPAGTQATYTTPGTNAGGDTDWLLIARSS